MPQQQQSKQDNVPPPPSGFVLESTSGESIPPPPPGFQLLPHKRTNARLPEDMPERMLSLGMSALPYAGAAAAGLATGGAGLVPGMLAAGAGGAIGSMVEQGARAATGVAPPGSFGEAAAKVGEDALNFGLSEGLTRGLGKVLEHYFSPEKLYQSALKPSGSSAEKASKLVATGLGEGIPATKDAYQVARQRWQALNTEVEDILKSQPKDIPVAQWQKQLQGKLDKLRQRWGNVAGKGSAYVQQIDQFERNFLLEHGGVRPYTRTTAGGMVPHPTLVGPTGKPIMVQQPPKTVTIQPEDMSLGKMRRRVSPMPAQKAQAVKKATYEAARTSNARAFEPDVHPGLQTRMLKDVASGLRRSIVDLYPELGKLGPQEGALIELEGALSRYAKREGNKQVLPYFVFPAIGGILGAHGGYEGVGIGSAAGVAAAHLVRSALEDPAVKSRLAIALSRAAKSTAGKIAKGAVKRGVTSATAGMAKTVEQGAQAQEQEQEQ